MPKYETVIHIINEGFDRYDAGEKAGDIIDGSKLTDDIVVSCDPTCIYRGDMRPDVNSFALQYIINA